MSYHVGKIETDFRCNRRKVFVEADKDGFTLSCKVNRKKSAMVKMRWADFFHVNRMINGFSFDISGGRK